MPNIYVDLDDLWDEIDDDELLAEAKRRSIDEKLIPLCKDDLLAMARRDPREALIYIERELGYEFIGLLTR